MRGVPVGVLLEWARPRQQIDAMFMLQRRRWLFSPASAVSAKEAPRRGSICEENCRYTWRLSIRTTGPISNQLLQFREALHLVKDHDAVDGYG